MSEKQDKTQNLAEIVKPGMTVQVHERIKDVDAKGKEK